MFALVFGLALGAVPLFYIRFRRKRRMNAVQAAIALRARSDQVLARGGTFACFADYRCWCRNSPIRSVESFAPCWSKAARNAADAGTRGMLKRMPEDDLRLLVVAIKVQSEVGASRADHRQVVRDRTHPPAAATTNSHDDGAVAHERIGGRIAAGDRAGRVFSDPGSTDSLFHDPTGQKILKFAMGMDLAAILTIRRLLRVSY